MYLRRILAFPFLLDLGIKQLAHQFSEYRVVKLSTHLPALRWVAAANLNMNNHSCGYFENNKNGNFWSRLKVLKLYLKLDL